MEKEELTPTNVNLALDELRPYIESDGGYLEFVEIDYTNNGPYSKSKITWCLFFLSYERSDYENGYRETYSDDISRGL